MSKIYSETVLLLFSVFCISGYAQSELPTTDSNEGAPVKLQRLPGTTSTEVKAVIEESIPAPAFPSEAEILSGDVNSTPVVNEVQPIPVIETKNLDANLETENSELRKQIAQLLKEKAEKEPKKENAPSSKFDLLSWSLSVPTDLDGNKKADQIKETELSSGYWSEYFYLSDDGGMVFKSPIGGFKTSSNTTYTRSELREMLRRGNTKIKTKGPGLNNWVLKSSNSMFTAGGHDGQLNATLKVDHVTTTGNSKQVGRVVIGQIHGEHDEPLRIYYRKLPNNAKGSIYFAHEGRANDKEDYYELIGKRSSTAENPEKGIALGEKFSYQVLVLGNILTVKITKGDGSSYEESVDMKNSGYSAKEEYMYFKAGVYNQNKTGDKDDYVQATFYELNNKHKKYVEPTY